MLLQVASEVRGLSRAAVPGKVEVTEIPGDGGMLARVWRFFSVAKDKDYLVMNFVLPELILLTFLLWIWPGARCRIVTLDFFAISPPGWAMPVVRWALRRTAVLLVYFKDQEAVRVRYGLPEGKLQYVPFKVNSLEVVERASPMEEEYIFVGGRSRRDFATLFRAAAKLPGIRFRVLTAPQAHLLAHGSSLEEAPKPDTVAIDYRDSDSEHFIGEMSRARLVVLPIREDAAVQAGIGVCLQALALGKCVIISEALGISDVLTGGEAVIVRPGDADLLASTIEKYWNDKEARLRVGLRASEYGRALGGEDKLYDSVLNAVQRLGPVR